MRKNLSLAIYFIATYLLLSTSVKTLSVEITQAIFAFLAASFASWNQSSALAEGTKAKTSS
jgi:hypothetical protein